MRLVPRVLLVLVFDAAWRICALQPCQATAQPLYGRAAILFGSPSIKDAVQVDMSGGKAARRHEQEPSSDLEHMRRVLEKTNPFEILDGKQELYAQIFSDSGRHVALRRTSKATSAAVQQAGKQEKVHYVVDTAKFNPSTNPSKVGDLMDDLRTTCQRYDVVEIKMDGLKFRDFGGSIGNDLNEIAPILETCAGLTSLSLSDNGLRDTGAFGLGLAHCTGLTRLDLSRNSIVWRQGALAGCTSLRNLNLHRNFLNGASTVELGLDLASCTALTELHLGGTQDFGGTQANSDAGMTSLVDGLKRCTGLTRLNLSHNGINRRTAMILTEALPELPALVHLDLNSNDLQFAGLRQLWYVLDKCTSLEWLDVNQNRVEPPTPVYVDMFMRALPLCPRLKHLDLSFNSLGVNVTEDLVRELPRCVALESLSLFRCGVSSESASSLASQLLECRALRNLDLRNNDLDAERSAELRTAWAGGEERDARLLLL